MIRYEKIGYAELNVTDLETSRLFYEEMVGLQYAGKGSDGSVLFRCSEDHHAVVLHQNDVAGFKRVGWLLEDESQFPAVHAALDRAQVAWEELSADECEARGIERAVRFSVPLLDAVFELYTGQRGGPAEFVPTVAKIQRLGHVVFGTPHFDDVVAFMTDVLNFRMSDSMETKTALMRCFPNPYHHGLGLARGPVNVFSHINFMVTEIDDIGRAFHRLVKKDVPIVYGPGRHPLSSSIFLYWLDPDGMTVEYSFGMEEFPEHGARDARYVPVKPEWSDSWGAPRDPRGMAFGAIEKYELARAT